MKAPLWRLVAIFTIALILSLGWMTTRPHTRLPTATQTARLTIDGFQAPAPRDYRAQPIFSQFFYDPRYYRGNYPALLKQLSAFADERKQEERRLLRIAALERRQQRRERQRISREAWKGLSKGTIDWAHSLSNNVIHKTFSDGPLLQGMAEWDTKNWVEVTYVQHAERRYLTRVALHRHKRLLPAIARD